ncbi:MAG: hypothetical protein U5R48_08280 [Gammaproteobacteria bacterium]|nr:hypothetical protein [Gammaproteobacteria bacterium]
MTQKRALNPQHPGSRFTIGSLETLADRDDARVRDELIRFYRDHYSADRIAGGPGGREDTATLEDWALELFAECAAAGTRSRWNQRRPAPR